MNVGKDVSLGVIAGGIVEPGVIAGVETEAGTQPIKIAPRQAPKNKRFIFMLIL